MVAGAPKTVSPPKEKCIELGEDLKKWATEETKEWRCLLGQWWCLKHGMLRNEWNALKQIKEFLPYYQAAQQALSVRCIDGTMEKGFGHRYIRLYDRELIEEENEQAKFDASLRKEQESDKNQKVVFEVNYINDDNRKVKISPKGLSVTDS